MSTARRLQSSPALDESLAAGAITATHGKVSCAAVSPRPIAQAERVGVALDVGRDERTATTAIRRALETRDGHCVFAGCTALLGWCDIHVIHRAFGGPISCDNGALLCERQLAASHVGGFTVTRGPAPPSGTPTDPTAPRSTAARDRSVG